MAGYTRQSIADIINGSEVTAPPLNAEFNQIAAAFQSATGHSHDGTSGNAPKIDLATSLAGYLPAVHGGTGGKNNTTAVTDPTVTDDAGDGYAPMSMWENTTTGRVFICVGNTSNAAVWRELVQVQTGNVIQPAVHATVDIGSPTVRFQDAWLSGGLSAYGNASFGGTLSVTGNTTVTGALGVTGALTAVNLTATGTTTINAGTINGTSIGSTTPSTGAFTTVSTTGTATLATADINGGTIDGAVIGAAARAAGNFTTVNSNAGITGNVTGNLTGNVTGAVTGNVTGNLTGNVTSSGASTFANADINGGAIDGTPIGVAAASTVRGTTVTATTGFVGNVTGNVTGNTTGTHTGNVTSASGTSTFNNLTVNGSVDVTNAVVQNVASPTIGTDAANKSYVDAQIAATIDAAPGTLDTLNELAAALGDDPNFATTVTNSIATKVSKAGDSMTGTLSMSGNKVTGLADPTTGTDAVTKNYVDTVYGSVASAAASAVAADASATSAENDRILVQSVYDTFDDRYLGAKASDPTLDNDGNALLTGALYFDNTNNITKVYNGTEWQAASSSIEGIKSSFLYTASASQTAFSGIDSNGNTLVIDKAGLVNVFLNGVRIIQDSDYTINASTDVVTLTTGAAAGDTLEVEVFGNFAGQSGADVAITGGLIDGTVIGGTTPAAGSFTQANFADNAKAVFGDGSDLQIFHSGTTSWIRDLGTGGLVIDTDGVTIDIKGSAPTEYMARFIKDGAVSLYYDNAPKLSTTSTGVDVTGTVTADGLTVDGATTGGVRIRAADNAETTFPLVIENSANSLDLGIGAYGLDNTIGVSTGSDFKMNVGRDIIMRSDNKTYFKMGTGGDISFYEDLGVTPKFFWDASAERLGLGTTNPFGILHLQSTAPTVVITDSDGAGVQASGSISFRDSANAQLTSIGLLSSSNSDLDIFQHQAANIDFWTNSQFAMRIDASGNVGIGTSSPTDLNGYVTLTLDDTAGSFAEYRQAGADGFRVGCDSSLGGFLNQTTADPIRFLTNSGERMRIDSSGNLLVGTTSSNFGAVGTQIGTGGSNYMTRSAAQPLLLNRLSSDGDILLLMKDTTTVGSIGVQFSADMVIGSGTSGVSFSSAGNAIIPSNPALVNTYRDAAINLGYAGGRFKDLYLSGGVYLGGTGAANKLDDYEEGTWTPVVSNVSGFSLATISDITATYTKVGRQVTLEFEFSLDSSIGNIVAGDDVVLTSGCLPFTPLDGGRAAGTFGSQVSMNSGEDIAMAYAGFSSTFQLGIVYHTVDGTVVRTTSSGGVVTYFTA